MLLDQVIPRLQAQVAALRSVEGAAEFQMLLDGRVQPQHSVSAYVIPLGKRAQSPLDASGEFQQPTQDLIGVVLMLSSTDRLGQQAIERIEPLINEVIAAIAGWLPSGALGPCQLARAALVRVSDGFMAYQIDFSVPLLLRIQP